MPGSLFNFHVMIQVRPLAGVSRSGDRNRQRGRSVRATNLSNELRALAGLACQTLAVAVAPRAASLDWGLLELGLQTRTYMCAKLK